MFKFDFNLDDTDNEALDSKPMSTEVNEERTIQNKQSPPLVTYRVEDLIQYLPSKIYYSPLRIPLSKDHCLTLLRRDLFDARFQLISESSGAETSVDDLEFVDAPSDIVPGVYEGGLKTWECSADLAGYLEGADTADTAGHARKILEVGCGTAVPSLHLLRRIFYAKSSITPFERPKTTTLHLQDYNSTVLRLVTLPNIFLTWYASPASEAYRVKSPPLPEANPSEPGELQLAPELLSCFTQSLREHNIDLTFVSGTWSDMDTWIREEQHSYDLILTSETIYQPSSLPSLISLLRTSSASCEAPPEGKNQAPTDELARLSLRSTNLTVPNPSLCLVAAKVIYFGVGGGIGGFEEAVKETGGKTTTVLEKQAGVSRRILQVTWPRSQSNSR